MKIESHVSLKKSDIDTKEAQLIAEGYRMVGASSKLQPYQYFRNEWSGTADSFEGPKNFQIKWCKPE